MTLTFRSYSLTTTYINNHKVPFSFLLLYPTSTAFLQLQLYWDNELASAIQINYLFTGKQLQ